MEPPVPSPSCSSSSEYKDINFPTFPNIPTTHKASSNRSFASQHINRTSGDIPISLGHVKGEATSGGRIYPIKSVLHFHQSSDRKGLLESPTESSSDIGPIQSLGSGVSSLEAPLNIAGLSTPSLVRDNSASYNDTRGSLSVTRSEFGNDGHGTVKLEGNVGSPEYPMTMKFKHEVSADGDNLIVTGREGAFLRCEDEPIHCPGAIQAYGVLIAFDEDVDSNLVVAQVSENSTAILGITPSTFFQAKCMTELFTETESEDLRDALEIVTERDNEADPLELSPISFDLSGRGSPGSGTTGPTSRRNWKAYCALHRPNRAKQPHRLVLELEIFDEDIILSTPSAPSPIFRSAFDDPDRVSDGTDTRPGLRSDETIQPSEEDLFESTVSLVQPLKAMVRLRKQREKLRMQQNTSRTSSAKAGINDSIRHGELLVVQLLTQIDDEFKRADDLSQFLKITAGLFRELTEFDRAMVYRFDENWSGEVVAEQVDWTTTKDLFRGLRFPAGDIPAQAREMYAINKVRSLYDRNEPTARLCCRTMAEVDNPLDMTHSLLRAMSPIHVKYLGNMGVQASMSVSIIVFGKFWGLVALHSYQRHRVTFPIRQLCRMLSDSIGKNIERLIYASRLKRRTLVNRTPSPGNPGGYIVATAADLLSLFDADFGCLSIGEEAKILGEVDNSQELLAILEYLREKQFTAVQVTQDVSKDFPDIDFAPGFSTIAGFLTVPLSREGKDFIVFCRKGQLEHIRWAGNPDKQGGGGSLEPRKSFKVWEETVVGKCKSWTDEQMDTPQTLLLIYGKFIDVWREKESLLSTARLANLLLMDASRSVRTPLNSIISCLEVALDSSLDLETRDNISKSYAASRTLVHVINDLLDLTRTEKGNELHQREPFNLPATITEAVDIHAKEARRRGIAIDIVESPQGTPIILLGDHGKVGRMLSEICSNALQHTVGGGGILIEWGELIDSNLEDAENKHDSIRIGISITDTGTGMSDVQLEAMFRAFEQISTISDETVVNHSVIGLGLARVARSVRTLGGQLRVESKLGEGSRVTIVLPFRLPSSAVTLDSITTLGLPSTLSYAPSYRSDPTTESSLDQSLRPSISLTNLTGRLNHLSQDSNDSVSISTASSIEPLGSEIDAILESLATSHMDQGSGAFSTRTDIVGGRVGIPRQPLN